MNNTNQKLSKVRFFIRKKKFRTFIDYNLSSFESNQQSVENVCSVWMDEKKTFYFQSFLREFISNSKSRNEISFE